MAIDDFLQRFLFGQGPRPHAAFDQLRIVLKEIDADGAGRRHEHETEEPALPEAQRTGRDEQQRREREHAERGAYPDLFFDCAGVRGHLHSFVQDWADSEAIFAPE